MKPGALLTALLTPPAALFGFIARTRGRLYDSGSFASIDTGIPVISVGNLTTGGTGKTPITAYIVEHELRARRRLKTAIISRGYGGSERGPSIVDTRFLDPRRYGDEPSWFASRFADVPVVVGSRRPASVAYLLARGFTPQIVVADDAFQHRRLKRALDVVILDATEPQWHYQSLPLGRLRENFEALKRADVVFISKTNQAVGAQIEWLKDRVREQTDVPLLEWGVRLSGFRRLGALDGSAESLEGRRAVLMSGLGRPESFEQSVREMRVEILKHAQFPDHYVYKPDDLVAVEREATRLGAGAIVVSEKDAVKLTKWKPRVPVYVSALEAYPVSDLGEFRAVLDRLL